MPPEENSKKPNKRKVLLLISSLNAATHEGVAQAAREFGWHLDLSFVARARLPKTWNGDGILCALTDHPEMESFITQSTLPIVDISMHNPAVQLPRVVADNEQIGRIAAEHLMECAYQNVAWFALQRDPVGDARLKGFKSALPHRVHRLDGPRSDDRERIAEKLSNLPRPCAIFAKTDEDAAWVMSTCLEEGYEVPDDFAIIGVDNNPLICDFLEVPLTSVNHDLKQLGYQAAKRLHHIMEGEPPPADIMLIPPQGVTPRTSTDGFAVQDAIVRAALIYMKNNLEKAIGTQEIANAIHTSKRTLETRFVKAVAQTVHNKLMELRLTQAELLIRTTSDTAETIAALTGFCHAQHLSRLFKNRYGQPPLRYRKQLTTS